MAKMKLKWNDLWKVAKALLMVVPILIDMMRKFEDSIDNGSTRKEACMEIIRDILDDILTEPALSYAMEKISALIDYLAGKLFPNPAKKKPA